MLIHEYEPTAPREILPLSDEVHLDISNHGRRLYEQPRELRIHPWLGPSMCEPVFLHDPSHFFEWAQASVRGQFHRSDNVLARGHAFLERARETFADLATARSWLQGWLQALLETANAVASLEGFPASGRRVMPQLRSKLNAVGHPEIYDQFLRLSGAEGFEHSLAVEWIAYWKADFSAASKLTADPELAEARREYHLGAYVTMVDDGSTVEILWPLLSTWDRAIHTLALQGDPPSHWADVVVKLGLSIDHASQREAELEQFMDEVERVLEIWGEKVGA